MMRHQNLEIGHCHADQNLKFKTSNNQIIQNCKNNVS